jgi:hypothetical protein
MRFLSSKTHTTIGLCIGVALLVAPWLFRFSSVGGLTVGIPLIVGLFIIASEMTTTSSASLFKLVPMRIHLIIDYLIGAFLAASPWIFGFANLSPNAWLPHLIVGLATIAYALITDPNVTRVTEEY